MRGAFSFSLPACVALGTPKMLHWLHCRAVVAYTHMMHGTRVQLAPLAAKDADTLCAELCKQAGKGSAAPKPNLEGRTLSATQNPRLHESPLMPAAEPAAAGPDRLAAAVVSAIESGPQSQLMEGRLASQPHADVMGAAAAVAAADAAAEQQPSKMELNSPEVRFVLLDACRF